jgi:hypothetical protein
MIRGACFLTTCLVGLAAYGQKFPTVSFHGRKGYLLENDRIRVIALRGGGHIAEVRFTDGDARKRVNPMRVPHYQTIEPYEYDPARHDALYGNDSHRWLSSGYMGHLLCFPAFGPPSSPAEIKNGLGNHGEAPIVEWKPAGDSQTEGGRARLTYAADLAKTHYRVQRTLRLQPGESVLYVEESVENLEPYDRPVNWVQHATFGPPFVAPGKSYLDMSGTKGRFARGASTSSFTWPTGTTENGSDLNLRPFQPTPNSGLYYAVLMDQNRPLSFFTMYNPEFPVLIGYVFKTGDSPWVGDFQENQRLKNKPWDGKAVTRGIEFGTTPMPEGLRRSVDMGTLFGVPTFRWISGRERLETSFIIFLAEIPVDFAGVADVTLQDKSIVIVERDSNRRITLPASEAQDLFGRRFRRSLDGRQCPSC